MVIKSLRLTTPYRCGHTQSHVFEHANFQTTTQFSRQCVFYSLVDVFVALLSLGFTHLYRFCSFSLLSNTLRKPLGSVFSFSFIEYSSIFRRPVCVNAHLGFLQAALYLHGGWRNTHCGPFLQLGKNRHRGIFWEDSPCQNEVFAFLLTVSQALSAFLLNGCWACTTAIFDLQK